jgi:hypothetical protein
MDDNMSYLPTILAAGDGETSIKLIVALIIFLIVGARKLAAKAKERRDEQQSRREERDGAPEPPPQPRATRPVQPMPAHPTAPPPPARGSETFTPPPAFGRATQPDLPATHRRQAMWPTAPGEEHTRTVRDAEDLDIVDEEVARKRQAMDQKLADRHRRMETAAPAEADTAAIDARLSHFQRMETQLDQIANVQVELKTAAALRTAIIYHEILSRPKALRQDPEMWDQ